MKSARNRRVSRPVTAWVVTIAVAASVLTAVGAVHVLGLLPPRYVAPVAAAAVLLFGWWMLGRRRHGAIPVLNYHSVSADASWLRIADLIAVSPALFQRQLRYLTRRGYISLTLAELHERLAAPRDGSRPRRLVALTFDDGYRDNWSVAFPLLKQYNVKATIFVGSGFVDETDEAANVAETQARTSDEGYLSWAQMRAMTASGLVEIGAHSVSHTRVFAGPVCTGYHRPGYENVWLFWRRFPGKRRRWWREDLASFAPFGHPIYRQAPGLVTREFHPRPELVRRLVDRAAELGAERLSTEDGCAQLRTCHARALAELGGDEGAFETDEAFRTRVREELREDRRAIEQHTGYGPRFFCWPENAFTEESLELARECGFAATVSNRHDSVNGTGDDPARIGRVFIGQRFFGMRSELLDLVGFWVSLKLFEGYYVWYPVKLLSVVLRKLFAGSFETGPFGEQKQA